MGAVARELAAHSLPFRCRRRHPRQLQLPLRPRALPQHAHCSRGSHVPRQRALEQREVEGLHIRILSRRQPLCPV